jgi:hypothetical protein
VKLSVFLPGFTPRSPHDGPQQVCPHTVRVDFIALDHAPFANKVTDSTRFSVKP